MKTKGVNRVVFLVKDIDKAVATYSRLLNTTFYPAAVAEKDGLRASLSYDAGIEIVSPLPGAESPRAKALAQALETHGEGLHTVIFSVDNVEEGRRKAEEMGIGVTGKIEFDKAEIKRSFQGKFKSYIEYSLNPAQTHGAFVVLGQF